MNTIDKVWRAALIFMAFSVCLLYGFICCQEFKKEHQLLKSASKLNYMEADSMVKSDNIQRMIILDYQGQVDTFVHQSDFKIIKIKVY